MDFEPTYITYANWKHPMEFFTLFIFAFAAVFLGMTAIKTRPILYISFSILSLFIFYIAYDINYKPIICLDKDKITYRYKKKQVEIEWKDVKRIGGMRTGKYGSQHLNRKELTTVRFFSTQDVYISISTDKPHHSQLNQEGCISFQYRKGILKKIEKLAGIKAL